MSGGHFDCYYGGGIADRLHGEWRDEELNALFDDLFGHGWDVEKRSEFGPRGGGLFESLDFWLSGDTTEEDYRRDVAGFKAKWIVKRTPRNRVEFYQTLFEERATELMERYKAELGGV